MEELPEAQPYFLSVSLSTRTFQHATLLCSFVGVQVRKLCFFADRFLRAMGHLLLCVCVCVCVPASSVGGYTYA